MDRGLLVCFQFGGLMKDASINICVCVRVHGEGVMQEAEGNLRVSVRTWH